MAESAATTPSPASIPRSSSAPDATRLVIAGLITNVVLAFIKLLAGLIGNSYALIADAIESLADIFGSAVIWGGMRLASRPVSSEHPYGYGKAEPLAALVVAVIVFLAGIAIGIEAVREIITPHHLPEWWTLPVLIGVVAAKETLFRLGRAKAGKTDSTAMATEAWHHRADAITSLAAFIGIAAALYFKWAPADDIAALFAACIILYNATHLIATPVRELLDRQQDQIGQRAGQVAATVPGVVKVQKVFSRKSGTRHWLDMHVWVDGTMSVRDGHTLAHRIKDAVRAAEPGVYDVLIHIEPAASTPRPGAEVP
ncbi:MAG: cation diffusion facilitator family transporter [Planctomycetota bacterium]|nr:cation diffusion facilitator family transporter [Planctomycetota bacterium]